MSNPDIKARGDAAAATFPVGTRVRRPAKPYDSLDAPDRNRVGTVVKITRSHRYGHAYIHVAWWPRATYPDATYRYLDGRDLVVEP